MTITGEGLQILTYTRHLWPLSRGCSLACHTYCDTGHYNEHLRGPVTLTPVTERLAVELSLPVFTTKVSRSSDSNSQLSACETNSLTECATAVVKCINRLCKLYSFSDNKICISVFPGC